MTGTKNKKKKFYHFWSYDHDQGGICPWPDPHSGFLPKGNILIKKFYTFQKFIFSLSSALCIFFYITLKLILSAEKPRTKLI